MSAALSLVRAFLLFAPLLVAAALSAVVLRYDLAARLNVPVDGGRELRGCRIFGDHKTWRGFATAIVGCAVGVLIERALGLPPSWCAVDYEVVQPVAFGAAMGLGAMLGELPNSFVKRRLGITPGATASGVERLVFWAWDQIDTLTGAWPLVAFWVRPTPALVGASVILALTVHPLVALLGFGLGARASAR